MLFGFDVMQRTFDFLRNRDSSPAGEKWRRRFGQHDKKRVERNLKKSLHAAIHPPVSKRGVSRVISFSRAKLTAHCEEEYKNTVETAVF
jgi:hypothetical protein